MPDIAKVSGVAEANIAKIDGVAKASIAKVSGVSIPAGASITSGAWYDIRPWDSACDSGSGTSLTNLGSLGGTTTMLGGVTRTTVGAEDASWFCDGVNDYTRQIFTVSQVGSYTYPYTTEGWIYREARVSSGQYRPQNVMSLELQNTKWVRQAITNVASSVTSPPPDRLGLAQHRIDSNQFVNYVPSPAAAYQAWYHIVTVYRSNATLMYIDGSLAVTEADSNGGEIFGDVTSSDRLLVTLGSLQRYTFGLDAQRGYHGDYRIYDGELTAQEIQDNYDATKGYYGL